MKLHYPKIIFHYTKNYQTGMNSGQSIWEKNKVQVFFNFDEKLISRW